MLLLILLLIPSFVLADVEKVDERTFKVVEERNVDVIQLKENVQKLNDLKAEYQKSIEYYQGKITEIDSEISSIDNQLNEASKVGVEEAVKYVEEKEAIEVTPVDEAVEVVK